MSAPIGIERCQSFINAQLHPPSPAPPGDKGKPPAWRSITISRESGSGGHAVAEKLLGYLQAQVPAQGCAWTVFDRNLVEKVLEDHHLPSRLAQFMPEDRISEMADMMDELFGLRPPSWTLVRQTADTILHLAELGNVILIGRGANVITAKLDYVFHVRLVASLESRIEYIQRLNQLTPRAAREFVLDEDRGRRRYLKKYFDQDIDNPLLYHVVINTDLVSYDEAARMIAHAVAVRPPQ